MAADQGLDQARRYNGDMNEKVESRRYILFKFFSLILTYCVNDLDIDHKDHDIITWTVNGLRTKLGSMAYSIWYMKQTTVDKGRMSRDQSWLGRWWGICCGSRNEPINKP